MAGKTTKSQSELASARRDVFEEFFNDYFKHRRRVYYMNFIRGIWFGLGSVIGGTLVLAGILWILSLFQQIPFLTEIVETVQTTIEESRR